MSNPLSVQDDFASTEEYSSTTINVLANDSGDGLTIIDAYVVADFASVTINENNTLTYYADIAGSDTIIYYVQDMFGNVTSGTLYMEILTPVIGGSNTAPMTQDDHAQTDEFSPLIVDVLSNDMDLDGDYFYVSNAVISSGTGGVFIDSDRTVLFTPSGVAGDVQITYTVVDDFGNYATGSLFITISPIGGWNTPPVANYDYAVTAVNTAITVDVLANDTDADGDILTLGQININPNMGSVAVNADGTVTFSPKQNFVGDVDIDYYITDSFNAESFSRLSVVVEGRLVGDINNNSLVGSSGNDIVLGLSGDDVLQGANGNDTLEGGVGNDYLIGGNGSDNYIFNIGDGHDIIDNYESDITDPPTTNNVDKIVFGTDITQDDIKINIDVYNLSNMIVSINGTTDSITILNYFNNQNSPLAEIKFADGASWNQLALTDKLGLLMGEENDNTISGTESNNILMGLDGHDTLDGNDGDDVLIGGVGNDALQGDNGNDTYIFNLGDGQDTIYNFDSNEYYYGINSVDKLIFGTGINPQSITLNYSGLGDEDLVISINGSADKITLQSYFNTTLAYELDAIEFADGTIWNQSQISQMPVMIQGSAEDNILTGLHRNEVIKGLDSNDNLYGHDGDDVLIGGVGNDALQGDNGSDTYIFNLGDGQDTIYNFDSNEYYYGINSVDKLVLGAGITASDVILLKAGNNTEDLMISIKKGTANSITLQSYFNTSLAYELDAIEFADGTIWDKAAITVLARANMRIEGTVGSDVLHGGVGDDTFVANHARDIVIESFESGIDTVESSVSFSLGENLENLTLIGSANLSGTGNAMNNLIIGNSGNNRLLGGDGNDILYGLGGGDTLNGGAGADSMLGGLGNDTFTVENVADVVMEFAIEGYDTVNSFISYTLTANVERLSLEGIDNLDGIGNELDNVLNGNNANNHLVGGAGDDTLQGKGGTDLLEGGHGNDLYYVDNVGDTVLELANEGVDKVSSNIDYTLSANVERLFLTGIAGLTGIGNSLNNVIYGNEGNNKLSGDAGNDSLNGGLGNDAVKGGVGDDTLVGGLGNDSYLFAVGDGRDLINNTDAGNGNDKVLFDIGITAEQLWLRQVGNDLEISIIGRADSIKVQNWYSDATKRVDSFELAAGNVLLASEVENLVAAMSAFTPPSMGQTSLSSAQHSALDGVIATNWESLTGTA